MQPALRAIVTLLLVLAACGGGSGGAPITAADGPHDLTDPDLQARLGVPSPTIDWSREVGRVEYVGSGRPAAGSEVELLSAVIDEVPSALDDVAAPRWIVRSEQRATSDLTHPNAVAFAFGPDIYLLDGSFRLSIDGSTRFDLARAYIHELAHVAQFLTLDQRYVEAALGGEITGVDPVAGSSLVDDFAQDTGWVNEGTDLEPAWRLNGGVQASTSYGATNPGEDMAEALALVVLGLADLVPEDRVRWIEGWLGDSATTLANGRPWAPAGAQIADSGEPLWDADAVETLAIGFEHVEPLYFLLPDDGTPVSEWAAEVTGRLRERLMAGEMDPILDGAVPRYGGRFLRQDGSFYWVELWDFPAVEGAVGGPPGPVLVYVAIW